MIRVLEYGWLSQEVYGFAKESKEAKQFDRYMLKLYGWRPTPDRIPFQPHKSAPFYAELWWKQKANEAVIVFRGTNNFDNLLTDIKSWYPDVILNEKNDNKPAQYLRLAVVFYHEAKRYLRKNYPKAHLSFTGHSLGGALAQLVSGLNGIPFPVVAFNSPGIGYMAPRVKAMSAQIHNINSRYGFINKVGEVVGSVDYVDVPEEESLAKDYFDAAKDIDIEKELLAKLDDPSSFHAEMIEAKISRDEKVEDFSLLASCYPQHKISNLVHALQADQNKALANRSYFGLRV